MLELLAAAALAACGGFLAGRWQRQRGQAGVAPPAAETRSRVLGLVPGEDAELGIDYLIEHVPVTARSLHIHLAVASLARERGETEDAIRVHNHLLEHLGANVDDGSLAGDVRMELVRDYLAAGLLDRAELLLTELIAARDPAARRAEEHLLEVYQRERDWPRAVELGRRLVSAGTPQVRCYLAHFLCELADEQGGDAEQQQALYREALAADPDCVRARLALGGALRREGHRDEAVRMYTAILERDTRFASEALAGLRATYAEHDALDDYLAWLEERESRQGLAALTDERVRVLRMLGREDEALPVVREQLASRPSARLFRELMELEHSVDRHSAPESVHVYAQACVDDRPDYRCEACGFSTHLLLWCCPSCQRWSSVLPMDAIGTDAH